MELENASRGRTGGSSGLNKEREEKKKEGEKYLQEDDVITWAGERQCKHCGKCGCSAVCIWLVGVVSVCRGEAPTVLK